MTRIYFPLVCAVSVALFVHGLEWFVLPAVFSGFAAMDAIVNDGARR